MTMGSILSNWGLIPSQIQQKLKAKYWQTIANIKLLLAGQLALPVKINLKPPSGRMALNNMQHFQAYISAWQRQEYQDIVVWQEKSYRDIGQYHLPSAVAFSSVEQLIAFMDDDVQNQYQQWQTKASIISSSTSSQAMSIALSNSYEQIDKLSIEDCQTLARLLPQLKQGMAKQGYLRALPLIGVDTKFIESNLVVIERLASAWHSSFQADQSLLNWLNCKQSPKGWLTILPLDNITRAKMANLAILQLPSAELAEYELPADNILVVENLQAGLSIPELTNTIAVIGCGRNITWLNAQWLKAKNIAYWGDIDSWGLTILSDARGQNQAITALMMDLATLNKHEYLLTTEPTSNIKMPEWLTKAEQDLFQLLAVKQDRPNRLEQERLPQDYITNMLYQWHQSIKYA